jgi:hypothetical protein
MESHVNSFENPLTLSKLKGKPSGEYWVKFGKDSPPVKLYFFIEENGMIWMRGQHKMGA